MSAEDVLEARGGQLGGADALTGQLVVVRLDGPCLDVFHETGCQRFHTAFIDTIAFQEHPSQIGTALAIQATRQGLNIPVRFDDDEREKLEEILRRVRGQGR
jgi:hypothetical protein